MPNDKIIDLQKERERLKQLAENPELIEDTAIENPYFSRIMAESAEPNLAKLNNELAFIHTIGSKPAVKTLVYSEVFKKEIVEFITAESLFTRYSNLHEVDENGRKVNLGKWWLAHPHRKEYETVTFEPDKAHGEYFLESGKGYYNLWEGFTVVSKKGSWKRTLKHIYTILCNSDSIKFRYVMRWFAWCIQNPDKRAEVVLVFKGGKGAGKGFICTQFVKLFGRHGLSISNREHLTGKHNQHFELLSFLFADEAYNPGDREAEGVLKQLITEPYLTLEPKFKNVVMRNNCLHIVMSSNSDWIVPVTTDERRYFINKVDSKYSKGGSHYSKKNEYFIPLWREMDEEGLSYMLHDLLNMDLKKWHPRDDVPETEELKRQAIISLPKKDKFLMNFLDTGIFPGEFEDGKYEISSESFNRYLKESDINPDRITAVHLRDRFRELSINYIRKDNKRYIIFPNLKTLKEGFIRNIGSVTWIEPDIEWVINKIEY